MLIVGLTGGIASGKSTVTRMLREHLPVLDCDEIAHEQLQKGHWGYRRVLRQFGHSILQADGEIDRDALGDAVFSDPAARKRLNAATHLTVAMALVRSLLAAWLACKPIVVIDMALLFESGAYRLTRPRVLVACDEQNQQQRLMARNGLTAQQALARVSSQMPLEAKRRLADIIIDNNGSIDATQEQVTALIHQLKARRWTQHLLFGPMPIAAGMLALCRAIFLMSRTKQ